MWWTDRMSDVSESWGVVWVIYLFSVVFKNFFLCSLLFEECVVEFDTLEWTFWWVAVCFIWSCDLISCIEFVFSLLKIKQDFCLRCVVVTSVLFWCWRWFVYVFFSRWSIDMQQEDIEQQFRKSARDLSAPDVTIGSFSIPKERMFKGKLFLCLIDDWFFCAGSKKNIDELHDDLEHAEDLDDGFGKLVGSFCLCFFKTTACFNTF